MRRIVKSLVFTVVVPGTVTVLIPYLRLTFDRDFSFVDFQPIAVFPIALGGAFYLWCLWNFTFSGRGTPAPIDPPKVLVAKGLYRPVRNPMYVGVLLILLGETIFYGSWTLLRYALAFALGFHLFVVYL